VAEEGDLLAEMLRYLAAAVVFVPLVSWLGLGSVLGYLVAGCVIGPYGLGWVHNVESIRHFSEFGVVLMLFVIGLELDPKRLWSMRRAVFQGGALQLLVCAVACGAPLLMLGLPWRGAVTSGLALALSSTAIAMQLMSERNLTGTTLGRAAFAVLLFQDIAAIPLVGLVPLLSDVPSPQHSQGLEGTLKVLGAIVAVVFVGRYLTRPALRIVAGTELRELFTGFALLLVVGIAHFMESVGLSMALGAFLAGVLLASSEYRHALESDIEPFRGLLMGLFFMSVGMSIDFGLFARKPLDVFAALALFILAKVLALATLAKPLAVQSSQRWLLAGVLGQGGEFAFVVFGAADQARLLPGDWDAILTLVVALSMAVSPVLVVLHDKISDWAANAREREYDAIETTGAPVIMAGFGRYGQIVGRMLMAAGVKVTVLDHDPETIEFLRKYGFRVFYGDATRVELLESAGAARAKVLVNAIDNVEDNLALVDLVRSHFPHLKIVARARHVSHFFELKARGVQQLERETFESALVTARSALTSLGVSPYEARQQAVRFRRHNLRLLDQLESHYYDETRRLSTTRAWREELEQQFERDREALERWGLADGWQQDEFEAVAEEHNQPPVARA